MKIETIPLEDHQVKLTVEIDPEPFEQAKRRAARQISKRTKIPGFRPGKAPYNVIQRYLGDEAILEEGLELLIKDVYPTIIEEAKISPAGPGRLENVQSVEPLTLEFVVPLAAEVELGDYQAIRLPYELEEISAEEVAQVLDNLRERQAIEESVSRPAEEGDHIYTKLSARRLQVAEGETPILVQEQPYSVVIPKEGGEDSQAWPYPGFARQMIGSSANEHIILAYTFPEDSDFENLRGVATEFAVTIEEVKSRTLPEINDEFAQSIGEFETLDELRTEIRKSLEQQQKEKVDSEYDEEILSKLLEETSIKYPPQMLEAEIDEVIHQLGHRLERDNLDLETYMKTRDLDNEGLREEVRPVAENRLKRSLILSKISKSENIEVDQDELQEETERTLNAMTRMMKPADLKKIPANELVPNLVGNIMAEMKIDRTLERLRAIARGEQETSDQASEVEEIVSNAKEGDPETEKLDVRDREAVSQVKISDSSLPDEDESDKD